MPCSTWSDTRGGTFVLDDRLPATSRVWDVVFPARHVLIRPYIPEGFRVIPGTEGRPFEQRTILLSRNPKWPRIWGWVLAIRERDLAIDPSLEPGNMIIFKRFADESIAEDDPEKPLWPGQTLPVSLIHIESVECTFSPPLIEQQF